MYRVIFGRCRTAAACAPHDFGEQWKKEYPNCAGLPAMGLDIKNGVDLTQSDMLSVILSWIAGGMLLCATQLNREPVNQHL